jgi:hypothetical protein
MLSRAGQNIVARLARGDVNMPDYDGPPIERQVDGLNWEVAVADLLLTVAATRPCRLLYHRAPVLHPGPNLELPKDISGRSLLVFEEAEGRAGLWGMLTPTEKVC